MSTAPSDELLQAPLVSVVLLNFNGERLAPLWESIFQDDYSRKEVIFVDNGSKDKSVEAFNELARRYPTVDSRVVRLWKNVGYSGGNNAGYEESRGELICLLSNDVRVSRDWIEPVVSLFSRNPQIAIVQSHLYRLNDPTVEDEPTNSVDPFGFNHPLGPLGCGLESREVFYSEGSVMFVRRSLISELGYLFPPDYFMMFEDADLCWRARLRGFRSVVSLNSKVYHARGATEPGKYVRRNIRLVSLSTRNRLATLYTNYSVHNAVLFIPCAIAIELAKTIGLASKGYTSQAVAVVKGVVQFLGALQELSVRRRVVQCRRTVKDRTVMKLMENPIKGLAKTIGYWGPALRDLEKQFLRSP